MKIRNATFFVEVADEDAERWRGLSGRASLPIDGGMLFVFEQPGKYGFWMYDMRFPLDIVWIGADRTVVHIVEKLQPCMPSSVCESYLPDNEAKYVLEINAGLVEKYMIKVGDRVEFSEGLAD